MIYGTLEKKTIKYELYVFPSRLTAENIRVHNECPDMFWNDSISDED